MKRVLLVNPSYTDSIYRLSKVRAAIPVHPFMALAVLAGELLRAGHLVEVLDLNIEDEPLEALLVRLREFEPHIVGVSFTTPLFDAFLGIVRAVKDFDSNIMTVAGGPHATALPDDTLHRSAVDAVVVGEGDQTIVELVSSSSLSSVSGLALRRGTEIVTTCRRPLVGDMDGLAMPAWELFNVGKYRGPHLNSKANPIGYMETSRGCFSHCVFCSSRNIFGLKFRAKSATRVVDEIEHLLGLGFREIQMMDDGFATSQDRVAHICQEIRRRRLRFPWQPDGGIRVDRASKELFSEMKSAGCYRVPFGIESGSGQVLDRIGKGITLEQATRAVRWADDAGLETLGYFILGLPGESEETIRETIEFALKLPLTYAKFAILIPLPGSPLFQEWSQAGVLKTMEWRAYHFASPDQVYEHPSLPWEVIQGYYSSAHRRFYWRPSYLTRRFINSCRRGQLIADLRAAFKTRW